MTTPPSPNSTTGAGIVQTLKVKIRREALERRRVLADKPGAAVGVADGLTKVLTRVPACIHKTIAGYYSIGEELPSRPALAAAAAAHARLCLPVVIGPNRELIFRHWRLGGALVSGAFGTMHPPADALELQPDIVLVPLVAFDGRGHRLGYGRGYYDRTLGALRAGRSIAAIGLAFDTQEVEEVPTEPNDQPLDMIITDRRILSISSNSVLTG